MTNSTTFPGTVTATSYEGSGANLTGISAGFDPDVDTIAIGNGAGMGDAEYSYYIRPSGANFSYIYDYRNQIGRASCRERV